MVVCTPCQNTIRVRKWKAENRNRTNELNRNSAARPDVKARKSAYMKEYQASNLDKVAERQRRYRARHPERSKESQTKYRQRHHDKLLVQYGVRRHRHRGHWGDPEDVAVFYECAQRVTQCLNLPFEVDHIVPIRGNAVSGLHVPENLRVVSKDMNRAKGNRI